jgi:GNAT superfamily N-acetyltransferase
MIVIVRGAEPEFEIVDGKDAAMPEIGWLIDAPGWQGKGVARRLMEAALQWIGDGMPVQLGVIHSMNGDRTGRRSSCRTAPSNGVTCCAR